MKLPSSKTTIFTVVAFIIGGVVLPILAEMRLSTNQIKELSHKEADLNLKHLYYILSRSDNVGQQFELAKFFSWVSIDKKPDKDGWGIMNWRKKN